MAPFLSALVLPERAFSDENTFRIPRALIVVAVFLLHVTGSELVSSFYATPYVAGLIIQQQELAGPRFDFGPPGSHGSGNRQARGGARNVAAAIGNPAVRSLGIVIRSLVFVLQPVLTWWLLITFVQFLGGEEEKTVAGPHRNSQYLIWYAWIPLALRRLAEGVLIQLQDPTRAWSSLGLAQYRKLSAIEFSPLSLMRLPRLPDAPSYLLYNLTDPFYLWFLFVLVCGGGTVFRLTRKSALVSAAFVMIVLYVEKLLFGAIGISTGV